MKGVVYVIGYPGSGKTTAIGKAITAPVVAEHAKPFKHIVYDDGVVQLGANRAMFSGTDALPMNVQPSVLAWFRRASEVMTSERGQSLYGEKLIIGEGDRLGNNSFFQTLDYLGVPLRIVLIDVTPLQARYRTWLRGHDFDGRFWAGRITKVDNLKRLWSNRIELIDGSQCMDGVALELHSVIYG